MAKPKRSPSPKPPEDVVVVQPTAPKGIDYTSHDFRRLVSRSTLRKFDDLKGLDFNSEAFKARALTHITNWLDAYKKTAKAPEIDSKVKDAVYDAFAKAGKGKPISRKLLLMKVYTLLDDPFWDTKMNSLESQVAAIISDPREFETTRGPTGGTIWLG